MKLLFWTALLWMLLFASSLLAQPESWQYAPLPNDLVGRVTVDTIPIPDTAIAERTYSPNERYWYNTSAYNTDGGTEWPPWNTHVEIYGGGSSLTQVQIPNHANTQPYLDWITPKLLLIRVWWGRLVGADYIIDVESGTLLYSEMIVERSITLANDSPVASTLRPFTLTLTCVERKEFCAFRSMDVSGSATVLTVGIYPPVSTFCVAPITAQALTAIYNTLTPLSTEHHDTYNREQTPYRIEWEFLGKDGYKRGEGFLSPNHPIIQELMRVFDEVRDELECDA